MGRCVSGACRRSDCWVVVRMGLWGSLCWGRWLVAACGRVAWRLGFRIRVAGGARAWARLWAHGPEGLPGPGACGCCIRVAGHASPPGRSSLVLPDCCGRLVLRRVSLCRTFGCTLLSAALWRAGPRWCQSACSLCGVGGVAPVCRVGGCVGGGGGCAGGPGGRWASWRAGPQWCRSAYTCSPGCGSGARRGWAVMSATFRVGVEELWCWAPLALIRATAALPYVPGCGSGTSGWRARHATGTSPWGRGIPLHVR